MRLGILGSTRGTNLLALIDAEAKQQLSGSIQVVISNKADAFILERARQYQIDAIFQDPNALSRESYDEKISTVLRSYDIDLIVLIGYMRILSAAFVTEWHNKIINVHPSLLPLHAGKMDLEVHRAVLLNRETESGCTVHYVTEAVDAGPVIVQEKCAVLADDTPEILKSRVQQLEGFALIKAISMLNSLDS